MDKIVIADQVQHAPLIRALFWEYLSWGVTNIYQHYGLSLSATDTIEQDMLALDKFMPPKGRLLLAFVGEDPVGMACLKALEGDIGEIKRMYVRPEYRGQGIGRALLEQLFDEALDIGYVKLRLDSALFMKEAHQLYRAMGFKETDPPNCSCN